MGAPVDYMKKQAHQKKELRVAIKDPMNFGVDGFVLFS